MRVEYVITGLDWGGAEIQVRDLALGMRERGHEVGVLSLMAPRAHMQELEVAGVPVATLNVERGRPTPFAMFRAIVGARDHVRARMPDLVHSHMVHANILMRLVRQTLPSMRLVCTAHSTQEGGRLRDLAYRLTGGGALDTTVSEAATERFVKAGALPKSTKTVHNGIDCARFAHAQPRARATPPFRWLAAGRLAIEKDYPTLFAALANLPDCRLDIAGIGQEEERLRTLSRDIGVEDRVAFLGLVPDIAAIMNSYDAFVLSSAWEGFGLVVAEAMAAGLPVVATDSGGPREIVGNEQVAGFLVPPSSPDELASAMVRMMALTDDARRRLGEAGRARVRESFDLSVILDRWEHLYEALTLR